MIGREAEAMTLLDGLDALARTEPASFVITWDRHLGWKAMSGKHGPWALFEGWRPTAAEAVTALADKLGIGAIP